jgi:hypothetical protein
MILLDKIRPLYFFMAFGIGLLACYIMAPKRDVVVKFPSPYNAGKIVYRDKADTCYTYQAEKQACPMDRSLIKSQPIMEDFGARRMRSAQTPTL